MIVKSCANLNITCSYPFYVKCLSLSSSCLVCLKMGHFLSFSDSLIAHQPIIVFYLQTFTFYATKLHDKNCTFFCVQKPRNEFILLRIYILILHDVVNLNIFQIVRTPTHHTLLNTKKNTHAVKNFTYPYLHYAMQRNTPKSHRQRHEKRVSAVVTCQT